MYKIISKETGYKPEENDEANLISYVLEKIEIADDFMPKMKAKDRRDLRNKLLGLKSKRAIDIYFRNYIYAHI